MADIQKIKCQTAKELWQHLSPEKPLFGKSYSNFIYRGQADSCWKLYPKVFRDDIFWSDPLTENRTFDLQINIENIILQHFVEGCDCLGLPLPNDSIELRERFFNGGLTCNDEYSWPDKKLIPIMALAQHNGVPTRLLDWSRYPYVAAYFAASDAIKKQSEGEFNCCSNPKLAVWSFDTVSPGDYPNIELVKVPGSTSKNLAAQSGVFTLVKQKGYMEDEWKTQPFENEILSSYQKSLWKLTLPVSEAKELLKLCHLYNISGATLFPGYEGAARNTMDLIR